MALVVPAAFFSALDHEDSELASGAHEIVSDKVRGNFLKMGRGTAIILLFMFVFVVPPSHLVLRLTTLRPDTYAHVSTVITHLAKMMMLKVVTGIPRCW